MYVQKPNAGRNQQAIKHRPRPNHESPTHQHTQSDRIPTGRWTQHVPTERMGRHSNLHHQAPVQYTNPIHISDPRTHVPYPSGQVGRVRSPGEFGGWFPHPVFLPYQKRKKTWGFPTDRDTHEYTSPTSTHCPGHSCLAATLNILVLSLWAGVYQD